MESSAVSSSASSISSPTPTPYTQIGRPDHRCCLTALVIAAVLLLDIIAALHFFPSPLLPYCQTGSTSPFCRRCPPNALCSQRDSTFVCADNSFIKFDAICHRPGKCITSNNHTLLSELQSRINATVTQIGFKRMFRPVRAHNFVSKQCSEDDIVIAWTHNGIGRINGDGYLILPRYDLDAYFIFGLSLLVIACTALLHRRRRSPLRAPTAAARRSSEAPAGSTARAPIDRLEHPQRAQ